MAKNKSKINKYYLSARYGSYGSCSCSYSKDCTEKEAIHEAIAIAKTLRHCSIELSDKGK